MTLFNDEHTVGGNNLPRDPQGKIKNPYIVCLFVSGFNGLTLCRSFFAGQFTYPHTGQKDKYKQF